MLDLLYIDKDQIFIEELTGFLPSFFTPDLKGFFQIENYRTAIAAWLLLLELHSLKKKSHEQIIEALQNVGIRTKFFGRWQTIGDKPKIIADGGHNMEGMTRAVEAISAHECLNLHFVIGFVQDKNIENMLQLLPKEARYYFVAANVPRALKASILQGYAIGLGLVGKSYDSVAIGLAEARKNANENDLIFVGGSMFVVAEII